MPYLFTHFDVDDDFVIAEITDGTRTWYIDAVVRFDADTATLARFDIQGDGLNSTGWAELRALALWMKEQINVRQLRIEGSPRTSGTRPGRLPPPLVF